MTRFRDENEHVLLIKSPFDFHVPSLMKIGMSCPSSNPPPSPGQKTSGLSSQSRTSCASVPQTARNGRPCWCKVICKFRKVGSYHVAPPSDISHRSKLMSCSPKCIVQAHGSFQSIFSNFGSQCSNHFKLNHVDCSSQSQKSSQ